MAHETELDNVELSGFKGLDEDAMSDVKKIVSTHLKRYREICQGFETLMLKMKKIHAQEHSEKYEISAALMDKGKMYNSTITDKNLIFAVDTTLEKLESEISRKKVP